MYQSTIGSNKVDVDGSALKQFILLSNKPNFEYLNPGCFVLSIYIGTAATIIDFKN